MATNEKLRGNKNAAGPHKKSTDIKKAAAFSSAGLMIGRAGQLNTKYNALLKRAIVRERQTINTLQKGINSVTAHVLPGGAVLPHSPRKAKVANSEAALLQRKTSMLKTAAARVKTNAPRAIVRAGVAGALIGAGASAIMNTAIVKANKK